MLRRAWRRRQAVSPWSSLPGPPELPGLAEPAALEPAAASVEDPASGGATRSPGPRPAVSTVGVEDGRVVRRNAIDEDVRALGRTSMICPRGATNPVRCAR